MYSRRDSASFERIGFRSVAVKPFVSCIHRKKPKGRLVAERTRIANARKSKVRSAVEHVFAYQKGPMVLVVRTIGIARARVKIGLALAYNMRRFVWLRPWQPPEPCSGQTKEPAASKTSSKIGRATATGTGRSLIIIQFVHVHSEVDRGGRYVGLDAPVWSSRCLSSAVHRRRKQGGHQQSPVLAE
jgi:hypothetical protein